MIPSYSPELSVESTSPAKPPQKPAPPCGPAGRVPPVRVQGQTVHCPECELVRYKTLPPAAVAVMQPTSEEGFEQKAKDVEVVVEEAEYNRAMSQLASVHHDTSVIATR